MTEKACVFSVPTCTLSSVAQAGQPQGWPVIEGPEFQTCLGHHQSLELFDGGDNHPSRKYHHDLHE